MHHLTFSTVILTFMLTSSFNLFANDTTPLSRAKLMSLGKVQYKICGGCHGMDGKGNQYFAPALTNSPIANGPIYPLISVVIEGVAQSENNKWNAYMPAWAEVFSNNELASVITFIRNSLGNSAGDLVQPDNIKIAKILYKTIRETELPSGVKTCDFSIGHEPIRADNVTIIKVGENTKHRSNNAAVQYSPIITVIAKINGICKYVAKQNDGVKEKKDAPSIKHKPFTSQFEFEIYQNNFDEWVVIEVI